MFTRVPVTEMIPFTRNFQIGFFFIMKIGKIADIFSKKLLKNVGYLVQIFEIVWLGVVIELISSYLKVIATFPDS